MRFPTMHRTRLVRVAATVLTLTGFSTVALAQHSPALDRVGIWLGGYYAAADTTIRAGVRNVDANGDVNFEHDLGFGKRKSVSRARLDFLVGDRQGFSVDYFSLKRERQQTLDHAFDYEGTHYDTTTHLRGTLDFDFGSVAYRWWLGDGDDVFGIGLGGAYYQVRASIAAEASVNGEPLGDGAASGTERAWAPMLQLGWRHAFNPQWRMYLDASGVLKNGGRLSGHIYNTAVGVEWFPWQNVGLGAEYNYSRIRLDQRKTYYQASLDMKLEGPAMFVRFRF